MTARVGHLLHCGVHSCVAEAMNLGLLEHTAIVEETFRTHLIRKIGVEAHAWRKGYWHVCSNACTSGPLLETPTPRALLIKVQVYRLLSSPEASGVPFVDSHIMAEYVR